MKSIGGYFGLEVAAGKLRYRDAVPVNLGRSGLELIVRSREYCKVWLPDYICPVVPERLVRMGVSCGWYKINKNLEPMRLPKLKKGEAFLYVNYFGLKDVYCRKLEKSFASSPLILDLTQAYYYKPESADGFNSTRKFFGVPDGGFAFGKNISADTLPDSTSFDQCEALLRRADGDLAGGYAAFQRLDGRKSREPVAKMSALTQRLLAACDEHEAAQRRRRNLETLHKELGRTNELKLSIVAETNQFYLLPLLVYPYLVKRGAALRRKLIANKVFCPTYWPDLVQSGTAARRFARDLVCLPIDQRYSAADMNRILEVIHA